MFSKIIKPNYMGFWIEGETPIRGAMHLFFTKIKDYVKDKISGAIQGKLDWAVLFRSYLERSDCVIICINASNNVPLFSILKIIST